MDREDLGGYTPEELGIDPGQEPFPADSADLPAFFAADAKRSPFQMVVAVAMKAKGELGWVDIPLENLVTPESFDSWDIDALGDALEGYGVSTRTRYLAPTLAAIPVVETGDQPRLITELTPVSGYMAYVVFDEDRGVWRVDRIGPPDPEWEKVRLQDISPS